MEVLPLRKTRRFKWMQIPRLIRPTWEDYNYGEMWRDDKRTV